MKYLLTIELIPKTSFHANLRKLVRRIEWDNIRKTSYRKAGYKCEICGGTGTRHPVECHEIWDYNDENYTQTLKGVIALCPLCHEVKHIGFAKMRGNYQRALSHFCKINKIGKDEAERYILEVFRVWRERSLHNWDIKLDWLKK